MGNGTLSKCLPKTFTGKGHVKQRSDDVLAQQMQAPTQRIRHCIEMLAVYNWPKILKVMDLRTAHNLINAISAASGFLKSIHILPMLFYLGDLGLLNTRKVGSPFVRTVLLSFAKIYKNS